MEIAGGDEPTAKQVKAAVVEVLELEPQEKIVARVKLIEPKPYVPEDPEYVAKCDELSTYVMEEFDALFLKVVARAEEMGVDKHEVFYGLEDGLRAKREEFRLEEKAKFDVGATQ